MKSSAALMAALAAAFPLAGQAAGAARVDFAVGDVKALSPDGRSRTLGKGAEIENGETVDTGSGRTQLRFSDGAMVSLQPQTQFRIDAYEFKGAADGSEKGFFSLLKGAMRTITGAIGKADRKAYRLDTAVATIGIRGTEYAVAYGRSITVTTGSGLIEVCNNAGCLLVEAGQSAYVLDANTPPNFTKRNALAPLTQPQGPLAPGFSAGDSPGALQAPQHQAPQQRINQGGYRLNY
ncbi:MAG: FecR domain-containing protein [Betaproteobacteria bacterium]|nr:FecR domain-containing protein [Betaproteobacteria bacterium]